MWSYCFCRKQSERQWTIIHVDDTHCNYSTSTWFYFAYCRESSRRCTLLTCVLAEIYGCLWQSSCNHHQSRLLQSNTVTVLPSNISKQIYFTFALPRFTCHWDDLLFLLGTSSFFNVAESSFQSDCSVPDARCGLNNPICSPIIPQISKVAPLTVCRDSEIKSLEYVSLQTCSFTSSAPVFLKRNLRKVLLCFVIVSLV